MRSLRKRIEVLERDKERLIAAMGVLAQRPNADDRIMDMVDYLMEVIVQIEKEQRVLTQAVQRRILQ